MGKQKKFLLIVAHFIKFRTWPEAGDKKRPRRKPYSVGAGGLSGDSKFMDEIIFGIQKV